MFGICLRLGMYVRCVCAQELSKELNKTITQVEKELAAAMTAIASVRDDPEAQTQFRDTLPALEKRKLALEAVQSKSPAAFAEYKGACEQLANGIEQSDGAATALLKQLPVPPKVFQLLVCKAALQQEVEVLGVRLVSSAGEPLSQESVARQVK